MRRALIVIAALALIGTVAYAGDFHRGANLRCNQCHNMHSQQSHDLFGGGGLEVYPLVHYLLKNEVNQLCLSCHDGSQAADVLGPDGGVVRSAGGLNTTIAGFDTSGDGYLDYMGHTLGTTADAPGNSDSNYEVGPHGLECTNCHNPHGYAGFGTVDVAGNAVTNNWRNLQAQRGFGVSYVTGTNDLTKDVRQEFSLDYEKDRIQFNEPNTNDTGYGRFCDGCHVDFHGQVGDANIGGTGVPPEEFVRHPVSGVNIGDLGGGHSNLDDYKAHLFRVRTMSPTGQWGTQGTAITDPLIDDFTPTCFSCHRGHGNGKPFSLIYAKGDTVITEDGSSGGSYSTLCQQCHVQGG